MRGEADHRAAALEGVRRRLGSAAANLDQRDLDGLTNPETIVAMQADVQEHLRDGTLVLGNQTYAAPRIIKFKGDTNRVIIGNWSNIAPDAEFYVGGLHPMHWVALYGIREMFDLPGAYGPEMPWSKGDIHVGSDCWVTDKSVVLSGITIGHGAIVGTHAVVTKDVEPYKIVAGNPARVVGQRFTDEQVEALLRIAWWDWPTERVLAEAEWLNGRSVDEFVERFDPGA